MGIYKRKMFVIEAAVLILFASILLPIVTAQNKQIMTSKEIFYKEQSLDITDEKQYFFVFGPPGAKNADDYTVLKKMNETMFFSFKKDCDELKNRHLNSYQIIDQQLKIYIKYGITPECFTLENLTKAIEELQAITTDKTRGTTNGDLWLSRLTVGPHMILYCSLLSAVVNFQPAGKYVPDEPWSDIRKLCDIWNISKDSTLYNLLNKTIIFHYLCYIPVEVLFAGSLGFYLSLGLFPGIQSFSIVQKPFVGILFSLLGGGIYVYQGYDEWDDGVDNAILDFFIGFTPFSIVAYREFSQPTR